jgi:phage repressor protein C with HTH and peptisase S24 domain
MESVGSRIREIRGEMQQAELAEKLNIHKNTMANYERGERFPDVNVLLKILDVFPDIAPGWLLTGDGSKRKSEPVREGFVMFSEMQIDVDHGCQIEGKQVVDFISFKEEWLQSVLRVPKNHLTLLTVRGDSMSPTLNDGDIVLVDVRAARVTDSALYVLEMEDSFLVKRIQKKLDGSVVIKNENPLYEAENLPRDKVPSLKVAGRIVWYGKRI